VPTMAYTYHIQPDGTVRREGEPDPEPDSAAARAKKRWNTLPKNAAKAESESLPSQTVFDKLRSTFRAESEFDQHSGLVGTVVAVLAFGVAVAGLAWTFKPASPPIVTPSPQPAPSVNVTIVSPPSANPAPPLPASALASSKAKRSKLEEKQDAAENRREEYASARAEMYSIGYVYPYKQDHLPVETKSRLIGAAVAIRDFSTVTVQLDVSPSCFVERGLIGRIFHSHDAVTCSLGDTQVVENAAHVVVRDAITALVTGGVPTDRIFYTILPITPVLGNEKDNPEHGSRIQLEIDPLHPGLPANALTEISEPDEVKSDDVKDGN
jgi:hypothetical protein